MRLMYSILSMFCLFWVVVGITYLSLNHTSVQIFYFHGVDKLQHCAAYFVLGVVSSFVVPPKWFLPTLMSFWLMSGGIELLQEFQPSRQASIYDWFANLIGLLFSIVVYLLKNRCIVFFKQRR